LWENINEFLGVAMAENIKMDKLDDKVEIRVPSITKKLLSGLPPENKKHLNMEILKLMATEIHLSRLDYSDYLSTESTSTL
jgi:hypothetical protein